MSERYSTIPDDLSELFDHIRVEAHMRDKVEWLEDKVSEFLKKKPTHDEISKFLIATQDEILGVSLAQLFAGCELQVMTFPSVPHRPVRLPFPNEIMTKK